MSNKGITAKYNVILFFVFMLFQSIKSFLEYEEEPATILDKLFSHDALIGSAILFVLFAASLAASVWIIRSFWKRLVSPLFQVREITINESISILLVFAIVSIS